MNKPTPALLILPLFLSLALQGCGSKEVRRYPQASRPSSPAPSMSVPDRNRIPPTQRPYTIAGKTYYPIPSAYGFEEAGIASWYGPQFHGKKTSCGEEYDMHGLTAAHKILPMHTRVLVKNLDNKREIVLRINDRGPFVKDRVIDLSLGAAKALGVAGPGTARVLVTAMGEAEVGLGGQGPGRFVPFGNFREGEFLVQIGAFTNKVNADRLQREIQGQGRKAVSQVYELGDGSRYYRVQVWAGRTLDQARRAEQQLEAHFPGAFVIAR